MSENLLFLNIFKIKSNYINDDYLIPLNENNLLPESNSSLNFTENCIFINNKNILQNIDTNSDVINKKDTDKTEIINNNSDTSKKKKITGSSSEKQCIIQLIEKKRERKKHDKFCDDNIKRKINKNYYKFLVKLINKIIKEIIHKNNTNIINDIKNYQFLSLDYNTFIKNINKNSFNKMKKKTIAEIFKDNTSTKFKYLNNRIIYNNILRILGEDIEKILHEPSLKFFNIYYRNQNIINLSHYGLDINIDLDGIQKYEDFKLEQEKEEEKNFDVYIDKIENCIKRHFLSNKTNKFILYKKN